MTGIDEHIKEKDYGPWFKQLIQILSEKPSNDTSIMEEPGVPANDRSPPAKKPKRGMPKHFKS